MKTIGLDSGSTTTKGVLFENGVILAKAILPTAGDPKTAMLKILECLNWEQDIPVYTTGYGRKLINSTKNITEITCHAKGAIFLKSDTTCVIDIGGQDCKVITLNPKGTVSDFIMNDKCAAGTGRFVEVIIEKLGEKVVNIDPFVANAKEVNINSMCTVFAESEVISLIANGIKREDVALGIIHSICKRISNQFFKINTQSDDKILFTGGLSNSNAMREILMQYVGRDISSHALSQYAGAIGAAVLASEKSSKIQHAKLEITVQGL